MKSSKILLVISLFILILVVSACKQQLDFTEEGPFIILTFQPAGPDDYRNLFPHNYSIDENGTLTLYTESKGKLKVGNDAPVLKKQLSDEEIEKLKHLIHANNFWNLEEDLSEDSQDGNFIYISVYLTDQSKTVGGLNPLEPRFIEITDYITSLVDDEEYTFWVNEIKNYIYELNP